MQIKRKHGSGRNGGDMRVIGLESLELEVVESDGRPETGSDSGRRTDSCSGKEAASRRSEELR